MFYLHYNVYLKSSSIGLEWSVLSLQLIPSKFQVSKKIFKEWFQQQNILRKNDISSEVSGMVLFLRAFLKQFNCLTSHTK